MLHDYYQDCDETMLRDLARESKWAEAFEALAEPLHEKLYEAQSFDLLDRLSNTECLIISLDYVQQQVGQGGFIQLIQNGYVSLLVTVIEGCQGLDVLPELQALLDDALKVFVLNSSALSRQTTPKEFAGLYEEFREFEPLDAGFTTEIDFAMQTIVRTVINRKVNAPHP